MADHDPNTDGESVHIPMHIRIEAWWNGYDPAELMAYKLARAGQGDGVDLGPDAHKDFITRELPVEPETDDDDPVWPDSRIEVVQRLFGRGFVGPGGAERMAEICRPFGLTAQQTVLDVSSGLGGGPASLSEFFGVWVEGMECNPKLAASAAGAIKGLKGASKVKLQGFDPSAFQPKAKMVDCVLSRDSLHLIADKVGMLDGMKTALRDIGQMLITDYVTDTDAAPTGRLKDWIDGAREPVSFWSVQRYEKALSDRGLDIRVVEDLSPLYVEMIKTAFAAFVTSVQQAADGGKAGSGAAFTGKPRRQAALLAEAETWARRAAMLEAGEIKVYRFFALKRM